MKGILTHEEEVKKMNAYSKELISDAKKSAEFLVRSGIHTRGGKLSGHYKELIRTSSHVCEQN